MAREVIGFRDEITTRVLLSENIVKMPSDIFFLIPNTGVASSPYGKIYITEDGDYVQGHKWSKCE